MTESSRDSESTGNSAVDHAVDGLHRLDERPVEEHVGAFEQAHELLRRALDHES